MTQGRLFEGHIPAGADIVGELAERAYAEIPFGMGHADRAELFSDFRNFVAMCAEPGGDQLVRAVGFTVRPGDGTYYANYRRPGEVNPFEPDRPPGADHKHVFHYGSQTIERATVRLPLNWTHRLF